MKIPKLSPAMNALCFTLVFLFFSFIIVDNLRPTAHADGTVIKNYYSDTLRGNAVDSDGYIVSKKWIQICPCPQIVTIKNDTNYKAIADSIYTSGDYTFALIVTDNNNGKDTDIKKVSVSFYKQAWWDSIRIKSKYQNKEYYNN